MLDKSKPISLENTDLDTYWIPQDSKALQVLQLASRGYAHGIIAWLLIKLDEYSQPRSARDVDHLDSFRHHPASRIRVNELTSP